jgi:hypothetical protein
MDSTDQALVLAVFTALGTIVGYLGTEVGSVSMFNRVLWPSRFNNTWRLSSLLCMALLMPMGGPIHKAAVAALDRFGNLWKGRLRGDMLGTAFYEDFGCHYVLHGGEGARKQARNGFWITLLELIPWNPKYEEVMRQSDLESTVQKVNSYYALRPVFVLHLSRPDSNYDVGGLPSVDDDIGPRTWGHTARILAGILASETITLLTGILTVAIWSSLFAVWYLIPLILKIVALLFHVRRDECLDADEISHNEVLNKLVGTSGVYKVEEYSKGFFIIEGPQDLVYQFWYHYGHPRRFHTDKKGRDRLFWDRVREIASMIVVVGFVFVYPSGLIAFIFASPGVQWVWLGYQLLAMLSMHFYRFSNGHHIGTTQERLARELWDHDPKKACLDGGPGRQIVVELKYHIVKNVREGRKKVEELLRSDENSVETEADEQVISPRRAGTEQGKD